MPLIPLMRKVRRLPPLLPAASSLPCLTMQKIDGFRLPRILAGPVAVVALAISVGCGRPTLSLQVKGHEPLHVNEQQESTPVDVRIYQLSVAEPFANASFEALWLDDNAALGASKLSDPRVVTVFPATEDASPQVIDGGRVNVDTAYIGIMALYRRAENPDQRRLLLEVKQVAKRPVLHFHGFSISLQAPGAEQQGKE